MEGHDFVAYNPTRSDRHRGSFRIQVTGDRRGRWKEFAAHDEGGDALDLVAYCNGWDKRGAIAWAKSWLGLGPAASGGGAPRHRRKPEPGTDDARRRNGEPAERRRRAAHRLWLDAQPALWGTPAEAYLAGRGIPLRRFGRHSGALHYHPSLREPYCERRWPALVAAVTGGDGTGFRGVHRTYLHVHADGAVAKAVLERIASGKATLGPVAGGVVAVHRGVSGRRLRDAPPGDRAILTEGIEDALTCALAVPDWRVLCCLSVGNLAAVDLPRAIGTVLIAANNDPETLIDPRTGEVRPHPARVAVDRAAERFERQRRQVLIAYASAGSKDFNDRLRGL